MAGPTNNRMTDHPHGERAEDAERPRSAQGRWGDLIWAAAPIASGVTGVAGFAMLIAELFDWFVTGEWSARSVGHVLERFGPAKEGLAASLDMLGYLPISFALIASAPCLFLAMASLGERLEFRSSRDD